MRLPARIAALALLLLVGCGEGPSEPAPGPAVYYRDVTEASGIDFLHRNGARGRRYLPETMCGGGCVLDYDGDGRLDVYLVQSGPVPGSGESDPTLVNRLWRNLGDGRFADVTAGSGLDHPGYGMGAIAADYDGDGDEDVYVTNFGPNALFRNEGDGTFTDVTAESGTGDPLWSASAAFFDADGDGDLDLYVVNYVVFSVAIHKECGDPAENTVAYCHPDVYEMAPDRFYRNRGDGTFVDATDEAGLTDTTGKGLGVVVGDYDGDGRPDLYVANDSTENLLYLNRGGGRFEEVGLLWGVSHNENGATEAGMGVDAGDVDGDGRLDLFVTNLSGETNALYLGRDGGFEYATRGVGLHAPSLMVLGFGTDLLDVDNDGDLDIFVGNGDVRDNVHLFSDVITYEQPNQLFLNDGAARFTEVDAATSGDLAVPRVTRGSITFDHDDDGRLDLLLVFNGRRARLFRNVWPHAGSWIGFDLRQPGGNRRALGARVTVRCGERCQLDEVKAGSSYLTSSDKRLHFGLGGAGAADEVVVRWPDGVEERYEGLAAGRYWRLERGKPPR